MVPSLIIITFIIFTIIPDLLRITTVFGVIPAKGILPNLTSIFYKIGWLMNPLIYIFNSRFTRKHWQLKRNIGNSNIFLQWIFNILAMLSQTFSWTCCSEDFYRLGFTIMQQNHSENIHVKIYTYKYTQKLQVKSCRTLILKNLDFIRPHLDYGDVIYDAFNEPFHQHLESIHIMLQ